jgi:hypothetical protein
VKALLATVAIAILALAACSDDSGGGDSGGATTTEASAELSSYETISDLNETLAAGGIDCPLEYEGLTDDIHETSICTIDGEQAFLDVWFDAADLAALVAPEGSAPPAAVAYGANWSVQTSTPELAARVADAAGGTTTDA